MLILTSNGLSSEALQQEAKQFVHGKKVALVVTADNEYKEKNYHVERLRSELQLLNASVSIFDFDVETTLALNEYDVIEMIGGNPFYLLNSIRTNGFTEVLNHFAKNKCIIGCSAGSFVMTKSLELVNLYNPELNIVALKNLEALALTDTEILPHYSKYLKKIADFEATCATYEKSHNTRVIRINDGDAVFVTSGEKKIVSADCQ